VFPEEQRPSPQVPQFEHAPNTCEAYDAPRAAVSSSAEHAHSDGPTFTPSQLMMKSKKKSKKSEDVPTQPPVK
jgi:hypothetical protein